MAGVPRGIRLAGLALLVALSAPAAADERQFGEWTVRCDGDLYCIAETDAVTADGRTATFKLERSRRPGGSVFVTVGPDRPLREGMRVDIDVLGLAEPFGVFGTVSRVYAGNEMTYGGPAQRPLVTNLRRGTRALITVFYDEGETLFGAPLEGLTLALLEFDRRQGRMDRADAIVAWGGLPEDAAPGAADTGPSAASAPEAAPAAEATDARQAAAAPAAADAADSWPKPVTGQMILYEPADLPEAVRLATAGTGCDLAEGMPAYGAQAVEHAGGTRFYTLPCGLADVNPPTVLVRERAGAAEVALFERPFGGGTSAIVENLWYDGATATATTTLYDSPDANCGTFTRHVLDEDGLLWRLAEVRVEPHCSGPYKPPETYPLEWDGQGG